MPAEESLSITIVRLVAIASLNLWAVAYPTRQRSLPDTRANPAHRQRVEARGNHACFLALRGPRNWPWRDWF